MTQRPHAQIESLPLNQRKAAKLTKENQCLVIFFQPSPFSGVFLFFRYRVSEMSAEQNQEQQEGSQSPQLPPGSLQHSAYHQPPPHKPQGSQELKLQSNGRDRTFNKAVCLGVCCCIIMNQSWYLPLEQAEWATQPHTERTSGLEVQHGGSWWSREAENGAWRQCTGDRQTRRHILISFVLLRYSRRCTIFGRGLSKNIQSESKCSILDPT